ncbi:MULTISPECIES: hypothetical protein [Phyllobacterium]|uniref:Uncharacterized protein n=1 Tax=Phyllobacterium sophorae TaxID=1520277 RepID=A0A2P7B9D5_9HYPH|nr:MULTISPECIES: hypothetical protein [Phyllobacterium]PSH63073.1 hypothetical protein CU103_16025 [Phyllobacterium sophorae]UXN63811.1 hypothetical protein N8E89_14995 [Phyllobacterium sp. A18/5-2]
MKITKLNTACVLEESGKTKCKVTHNPKNHLRFLERIVPPLKNVTASLSRPEGQGNTVMFHTGFTADWKPATGNEKPRKSLEIHNVARFVSKK